MLERVHEHVVSEIQQSARTDTVFVVTAVLFNLIVLGINWAVAASGTGDNASVAADWVFGLLLIITIFINVVAVSALNAGRNTRLRLINGLLSMYKDSGVDRQWSRQILRRISLRCVFETVQTVNRGNRRISYRCDSSTDSPATVRVT